MTMLFFVALIIIGRYCGRRKTTTTKIRLGGSQIASGILTLRCGCRISKEAMQPCEAHRQIASLEERP